MIALEQEHGTNYPEVQDILFNQDRYAELVGLMEGRLRVDISTKSHQTIVKFEEFCERSGGCLELKITYLGKNADYRMRFNYHLNRYMGVVDYSVDGQIYAEQYGIPGGGGFDLIEGIEARDGEDPDLDFGKLVHFVRGQAEIGRKTFPEPTPPQT